MRYILVEWETSSQELLDHTVQGKGTGVGSGDGGRLWAVSPLMAWNYMWKHSSLYVFVFLEKTFRQIGLLRQTNFSAKNISKEANINNKRCNLCFFLFSFFHHRSLFCSFPFSSLAWFWSLSDAKNLPLGRFSLKWLQISSGSFSKNRLHILLTLLRDAQNCFSLRLMYTTGNSRRKIASSSVTFLLSKYAC